MPASPGVRSHTKPKQRALPGPPLEHPFRVQAGAVIVLLEGPNTVVIPAGGAWPGLHQLPESVRAHLHPKESTMTPGTLWHSGLRDADLPAAQALVLAQALVSVGFIGERLHLAEQSGFQLDEMSRSTSAGLIGTCRAYVMRALSRQWRQ